MSAQVLSGLRRWAAGSATDMAAVELLALVAEGRLLRVAAPWVQPCVRPGWFWLDPGPLAQLPARLRNRDRQLVALAVALLGEARPARARRVQSSAVAA
jgi:hypothetical protein